MDKNKNRRKHTIPIEKHDTAAWASMEKIIPESNVTIPSETQVINAKKYVDTNQK